MRTHPFAPRLVAAGLLAGAAPLAAQVQWQRIEYFPAATRALSYDLARDRFVVLAAPNGIGEPETWERDRTAGWLRRQSAVSPPWRFGTHAFAYDFVRSVTVSFSGTGSTFAATAETYEWDGIVWANRSPVSQPPARTGHAMAFDHVGNRVVLFGGMDFGPNPMLLADTWEWTGTTWIQRIAPGPAGRTHHTLAYDFAQGNVVMFGGGGVAGALGDTWTYVNGAWTPRAGGPPARRGAAMAHDIARARTVLFGGGPSLSSWYSDTWEWDGSAWTMQTPPVSPNARVNAGMASDVVGGGVVLVGGNDALPYADTWRWDGSAWTRLDDVPQPLPRHSHAMAFDDVRGELLVFGGFGPSVTLGDFWRWNGASWTGLATPGPSPRGRAEMAFDTARGEAVMFGGDVIGLTNQTWVWNGTTWSLRSPAALPSARMEHAMAYDRQRARVVMFGGTATGPLGDTWEWDGVTWLLRTAAGPLPRQGHALAYDARRGVTVLYGGIGAGFPFGTSLTDTWEWDGVAWMPRQPATNPGPRREFAMAWDGLRERVVVFGDSSNQDAWEWDGSNWTVRTVAAAPPPRTRCALAYDASREHLLLFGGQSIGPNYGDLWRYAPVVAATATPFGSGCAGSAGMPEISAPARPWLGDTVPLVASHGLAGTVGVIWLGASNAASGPFVLPLALAAVGMPGCTLLASFDASAVVIADGTGVASLLLPIPNAAGLLGVEIFAQAVFVDPPANPAGLTTTNALTLRLGGR